MKQIEGILMMTGAMLIISLTTGQQSGCDPSQNATLKIIGLRTTIMIVTNRLVREDPAAAEKVVELAQKVRERFREDLATNPSEALIRLNDASMAALLTDDYTPLTKVAIRTGTDILILFIKNNTDPELRPYRLLAIDAFLEGIEIGASLVPVPDDDSAALFAIRP